MKKKIFIIVIIAFVLMLFISSCVVPICNVPKTVLIDDSHNNKKYGGDNTNLISILQAMGYTISYTGCSGFFPENYGVFIIPVPVTEYSVSELQKISTFLSKCERKLLLIGEWKGYYDNTPLNNILSFLGSGISFNNEVVRDVTFRYDNNSSWPLVSSFLTHPVTSGLNSIVLFAATTINVSGSALALANTSNVSYLGAPIFIPSMSSNYPDNLKDKKKDGIVISGPFCVVAAQTVMSGKIVAVSDSDIFSDGGSVPVDNYIDVADNEQLLKNIINW